MRERETDSTLDDVAGSDRQHHGLWARRGAVVALALLLIVAATGWLGVHSSTASTEQDGYRLAVTYPVVARAGLDVPFTLRVHEPKNIDQDVVIGITAAYFRMFETQGFFPEPSAVTSDADTIWMTFSPPPAGQDLVIDYDAYIQPASQQGGAAVITLTAGGAPRASVTISTTLIP